MDELIGYEDLLDDVQGTELIGALDEDDDDIESLLNMISGDDDDDDDDDDLIEGFDEFDELGIGARRGRSRGRSRGRRPSRNQIRRAIAVKRRRGLIATRRRATAGRQIFFGGNGTQGGTAGVLTVSTKCQELCKVTRLFVVGDDGASPPVALDPITWSILDIKVGVKSQFTALEAIPGVMFQADNTAQTVGFSMDTIQPGTDFSIQVLDAPAASRFKFGAAAKALR